MIEIMDRDFVRYGEIVDYTSLQFEESLYDAGIFELHVNAAVEGADELSKGRLVIIEGDTNKCALITEVRRDDSEQDMIMVKGHELKIITRQRSTLAPSNAEYAVYNNLVEWVMRKIILDNFIAPSDPSRLFPLLRLGTYKELGTKVRIQETNKSVYEVQTDLAKVHGLGWRIVPDLEAGQYEFDVFQGVDRSSEVFFEDESGTNNIASSEYTDSIEDYKNIAYVFGEGEGTARKRILIGNATGWERHEIVIDARDLQSEEDGLTEAQYISRLQSRGYELLSEHQAQEFLNIHAITNAQDSPFLYGRDFYLGDYVTIKHNRWGLLKADQVTKVLHVWEESGYRQDLLFGSEKPTIIQKIKRAEKRLNVLENSKVRAQVSIY